MDLRVDSAIFFINDHNITTNLNIYYEYEERQMFDAFMSSLR
jgi:hypothetical protein